ncbi:hypothetical protein R3P38DRAFT_3179372 [Favolaschia claudopus]|uniref:Uncharacterized protein n=1 Tax=Favolaschia claudopus TaxID=2862362 RepID=A0AAW0CWI0_9AGAR
MSVIKMTRISNAEHLQSLADDARMEMTDPTAATGEGREVSEEYKGRVRGGVSVHQSLRHRFLATIRQDTSTLCRSPPASARNSLRTSRARFLRRRAGLQRVDSDTCRPPPTQPRYRRFDDKSTFKVGLIGSAKPSLKLPATASTLHHKPYLRGLTLIWDRVDVGGGA